MLSRTQHTATTAVLQLNGQEIRGELPPLRYFRLDAVFLSCGQTAEKNLHQFLDLLYSVLVLLVDSPSTIDRDAN